MKKLDEMECDVFLDVIMAVVAGVGVGYPTNSITVSGVGAFWFRFEALNLGGVSDEGTEFGVGVDGP